MSTLTNSHGPTLTTTKANNLSVSSSGPIPDGTWVLSQRNPSTLYELRNELYFKSMSAVWHCSNWQWYEAAQNLAEDAQCLYSLRLPHVTATDLLLQTTNCFLTVLDAGSAERGSTVGFQRPLSIFLWTSTISQSHIPPSGEVERELWCLPILWGDHPTRIRTSSLRLYIEILLP